MTVRHSVHGRATRRRKRHVILFTRRPCLGQGKRRLAAGIGDGAVLRFQRQMLIDLVRRLTRHGRWQLWMAATPDRTAQNIACWPTAVRHLRKTVFGQGLGDLGSRMARAVWRLPGGPVLLIGTDVPDIRVSHLTEAFRQLGRAEFVFGPASDGGFWLFGARRLVARPYGVFSGVRWSSPHSLSDSLATLGHKYSVAMVSELDDVDNRSDWMRWKKFEIPD